MKKHNYYLIVGIVITAVILAITIIGKFWTPYDVTGMNSALKNQAPSLAHIMGTDNFGRDVFSRVMNGCGTTFFIALCTVAIGALFGTIIGALTGYYGGLFDEIVMLYPQFCPNCAKRSHALQVPGVCKERQGHGREQSSYHFCPYYSEYSGIHADCGGHWF